MVGNLARVHVEDIQKVQETPVKWCAVSLSEVVNRGKRLDASVFDVDGRQARKIIAECKYGAVPICGKNGLASAYTCARFKRVWVDHSDFPIYQPSTILDVKPVPDGFISARTRTDINALRVHKGQVLLTCSGTVGNVSYVSDTLDGTIFSHDLLRITSNVEDESGFIYAYLKSNVGNKILQTNNYGAVVTHIEAEHLQNVPVPNAPKAVKHQIHNLITESYSLRDESNKLLDKADGLLKSELQLPPIQKLKVAKYQDAASVDTFSVKLSDLQGRVDASYHVPIVNAIVKHLQKHASEVTTVGDSRISKKVILPGRFKRIFVDENHGKVFIGGKQLDELDPSNKKYLSITHHERRIEEQLELQENTILITRSGTIGKVLLTPKHWSKWVASEHIIRVVPTSSEIAGYLSVFLASDYGYPLITRYTYGSVVDEIDDTQVASIPVPLLKNKVSQTKINDLALQANEKRYQAYKLEQQALRIMDKEVIYAK